jgi:hypothetical protein
MDSMDAFASAAVIGGLVISCALLVAAEPRRALLLWAPVAVLGATGMKFASVQAEPEWIAALIAFTAVVVLTGGTYTRVFSAAAGMALMPATLAGASVLEVAWSSVPLSLALVAGSVMAGGAAGYALRPFRQAAAFSDIALLVLLCSLAIMAGPTALLGWQRAAIAAEGDESSYAAPSLWCLLPVGLAFVSGFAWRLWRTRLQLNAERKRT